MKNLPISRDIFRAIFAHQRSIDHIQWLKNNWFERLNISGIPKFLPCKDKVWQSWGTWYCSSRELQRTLDILPHFQVDRRHRHLRRLLSSANFRSSKIFAKRLLISVSSKFRFHDKKCWNPTIPLTFTVVSDLTSFSQPKFMIESVLETGLILQ